MVEPIAVDAERSLDDLTWILAPDPGARDEETLVGTGAVRRARLKCAHDGQARLGLFHAPPDPRTIQRIALLLTKSQARMLDDLVDSGHLPPASAQLLPDDAQVLLWRVDCSGAALPEVDALISLIFSRLLTTGRPLLHYNCTFMLPLDLRLDNELEVSAENLAWLSISESDRVERYRLRTPQCLLPELDAGSEVPPADLAQAQAYEFFDTHLQEQLFDRQPGADDAPISMGGLEPTRHYRLPRDHIENWHLELVDPAVSPDGDAIEGGITAARVDDVSLHRYYNGLVLLAIRVCIPDPLPDARLKSGGDDWWLPLVYSDADVWSAIAQRQCEHWLRYTKIARLLYAKFWEQRRERKIAPLRLRDLGTQTIITERPIRAAFSPIVIDLLRRFLPGLPEEQLTRTQRLRQVADDRMLVHVAYALCGPAPRADTPAMEQFERLFSYALYVDQHTDGDVAADGWAYDQAYTRKLMDVDCLRRWQAIGSLSGYTNASSVYMGFGTYFEDPIARVHVPYIYARIQILALFFRATLNLFDRRIGTATRALTESHRRGRPFRRLRADFIRFTNVYWDRHLTPQVQGEEITERMMRKQDLEGTYSLLKDEMERADEYATTELEHWYQDAATWAGQVALLIAVAALAVPAAEMWLDGDGPGKLRLATAIAAAGLAGVLVWGNLRATRKNK